MISLMLSFSSTAVLIGVAAAAAVIGKAGRHSLGGSEMNFADDQGEREIERNKRKEESCHGAR